MKNDCLEQIFFTISFTIYFYKDVLPSCLNWSRIGVIILPDDVNYSIECVHDAKNGQITVHIHKIGNTDTKPVFTLTHTVTI